jgi:hypothetical protein
LSQGNDLVPIDKANTFKNITTTPLDMVSVSSDEIWIDDSTVKLVNIVDQEML